MASILLILLFVLDAYGFSRNLAGELINKMIRVSVIDAYWPNVLSDRHEHLNKVIVTIRSNQKQTRFQGKRRSFFPIAV